MWEGNGTVHMAKGLTGHKETILSMVKVVHEVETALKDNEKNQVSCKNDLTSIQKRQEEYFEQKQKVEVLEHQLKKLKDRYDSDGRD